MRVPADTLTDRPADRDRKTNRQIDSCLTPYSFFYFRGRVELIVKSMKVFLMSVLAMRKVSTSMQEE